MYRLLLRSIYKQSSILQQKIRDNDSITELQMDMILGNEIKISSSSITNQKQQLQQQQLPIKMFYNLLPIINQMYPKVKDPSQIILEETPNQNIFQVLQLTQKSSYLQYQSALSYYRTEMQMYGDQTPLTIINSSDLQFIHLLKHDSKYLQKTRKMHMINISLPGTIQCEDSRNFLNLRPVEQFRHTPLIPIAESTMQKHRQKLAQYHRRQFVLQVSKQSIVHWIMMIMTFSVCGYLLHLVWKKQEERSVAYSRLKYQRLMGQKSNTNFRLG